MSSIHIKNSAASLSFFVMETIQEELIPECHNQIIYSVLWGPDLAWSTSHSVTDGTARSLTHTLIQSHTGWSVQCYLLLNKYFMTHTWSVTYTNKHSCQIKQNLFMALSTVIYHTPNRTLRAVLMVSAAITVI